MKSRSKFAVATFRSCCCVKGERQPQGSLEKLGGLGGGEGAWTTVKSSHHVLPSSNAAVKVRAILDFVPSPTPKNQGERPAKSPLYGIGGYPRYPTGDLSLPGLPASGTIPVQHTEVGEPKGWVPIYGVETGCFALKTAITGQLHSMHSPHPYELGLTRNTPMS